MPTEAPRLLVAGYLSIDTVEQASLHARRQAGGAGLFAALGARHARAAVDLCASIGRDFPRPWLEALAAAGIDLSRLAEREAPSRRAHLVHAADGSRRSAHLDDPAWWEASRLHAPQVPIDLSAYRFVVACPMPISSLRTLLVRAEAVKVPVIADLNEVFAGAECEAIRDLLPRVAVLAPSREETRLLLPGLGDDAAAHRLAALGPAVVQKRGAEGAFLVDPGGVTGLALPAPAARLVDPTGAGDATVGALAAGLAAGHDLRTAAQAALAAGALTISGHGAAALCSALEPTPDRRDLQGVPA